MTATTTEITNPNQEIQSEQSRKNRLLALGLPILFIPVFALIFFLLGGGESKGSADSFMKEEQEEEVPIASAVNTHIPQADSSVLAHPEKLEAFEQSLADTARIRKERALALNEVIYQFDEIALETETTGQREDSSSEEIRNGRARLYEDYGYEEGGYEEYPGYGRYEDSPVYIARREDNNAERDNRQDSLINHLLSKQQEVAELNSAPEREVKSIVTIPSTEPEIVSSLSTTSTVVRDTNTSAEEEGNRFYGLLGESQSNNPRASVQVKNAIAAVVHGNQEITAGNTVKLRLQTDIGVNGVLIPGGSFVYGLASFAGDRVQIIISSLQHQGNLFEMELTAYDLDGLPGIKAPSILISEFKKELQTSRGESLDSAEDEVELGDSLGSQIGSSAIKSTKKLLGGKKSRVPKITLKNGYQVLLR